MSTEHRRPLAAFVVVTLMGMLVLAGAARSDAVRGMLRETATLVVAGSSVAPEVAPDHAVATRTRTAQAPVQQLRAAGPAIRPSAATRTPQRTTGRAAAPGAGHATTPSHPPPSHARAHDKGLAPDHGTGPVKAHGLAKAKGHAKARGLAKAKGHAKALAKAKGKGLAKAAAHVRPERLTRATSHAVGDHTKAGGHGKGHTRGKGHSKGKGKGHAKDRHRH